jgi:hypothetical protein
MHLLLVRQAVRPATGSGFGNELSASDCKSSPSGRKSEYSEKLFPRIAVPVASVREADSSPKWIAAAKFAQMSLLDPAAFLGIYLKI